MLFTPRQKTKKYLALLAFGLAMTSCSGSGDSTDSSKADSPSASSDEAENSDNSEESGENNGETDDANDSPAGPDEAEVADEPALPMANGVEMVQLTDKSGGGPRPMLVWEPVAESASYTVVVYDADGAPWWSWAGTDTEVVIGGVETDTEIGGPRAVQGARWSVMALDAEGNLVGASPKRSIQP